MKQFYFNNKIKNILLVVNRSKSFDQRINGDFFMENNILSKTGDKNFIFTGCQIINKSIFDHHKVEKFSMNLIWQEMILKKNLHGFESNEKFTHLTDIEIYKKLTKI